MRKPKGMCPNCGAACYPNRFCGWDCVYAYGKSLPPDLDQPFLPMMKGSA